MSEARGWKGDGSVEDLLRFDAREGNVFDYSNDTVVVKRAMLTKAANEIERLRAENGEWNAALDAAAEMAERYSHVSGDLARQKILALKR
jgi:hypothetical protein